MLTTPKRGVLTPLQTGLLVGGAVVLAGPFPNASWTDGLVAGVLLGVFVFVTTARLREKRAVR